MAPISGILGLLRRSCSSVYHLAQLQPAQCPHTELEPNQRTLTCRGSISTPRTGSTPAWDPYLSPASPVGPIPGSSRRGFSCSRPGREIPNFQTAPVLSFLLPVRRYNTHPAWLVGVVLNLPPSVRPLIRISSCLLRRLAALPRPQQSIFRDLFSAPTEHSDVASYSAFLLLIQYNRDSDKGGGTIRLCGEDS